SALTANTNEPTQAKITIEENDTTAIIRVSHDKAIEKIIYSWDNDKETTDKVNGSSEREIEVQLPAGQHTLNVKVVDVDGVETSYKKTITSENGTDIVNPVIEISVTEEKKIKITATDETEIAYVTYKWNDEEEERVDVSEDDKKKIEFEIDILKGNNDLTVVAVDANNRTTTESKAFAGVTKPEVKITVSADKKSVNIICTHENGLEEIKFNVNGTDIPVTLPEGNPKDANFDYNNLPEGNVTVKVTAKSIDGTTTEATEEIVPDESEETLNENIKINIVKSETDSTKAKLSADYSEGIKEVLLNVNDVDYTVTLPEENPKNTSIDLPLVQGNNRITLTIIGTDDTRNVKIEEIPGE
ncbi:hypothetical protein, partial [uncultured Clostridium sp.]|uniref:hypothetical protein n=1 Tax=uncultured Clostridium sp. TaxID=59620 RepID=UPI0026ED64CE